MGPGENAGAVDVGDGLAVAFKVESHNHPSAVEPFQGAATGVGGILRDIFALGARPIAVLDSLRFGELDSAALALPARPGRRRHRPLRQLDRGGRPSAARSTSRPPYEQNCLVNAMCVGLAPRERLIRSAAAGVGQPRWCCSARCTGRDGIGGASVLAQRRARRGGRVQAPERADRRPVRGEEAGRVLPRAARARAARVAPGPRRGGAVLVSSSEMASKGEVGLDLDVSRVPLREADMEPFEIMISESQERMLCVVEPGAARRGARGVRALGGARHARSARSPTAAGCASSTATSWSATCRSTALVDDCPLYDLEPRAPDGADLPRPAARGSADDADAAETLLRAARLAAASPASGWRFEQYDPLVGSRTVRRPEQADAAVLPARQRRRHGAIAVSIDGNGRRVACDPYVGAVEAVLECAREPRLRRRRAARPHQLPQLRQPGEAAHRLAARRAPSRAWRDACLALGMPVVGGNVSLYNEGGGGPIYPTPVVGMVGKLPDPERVPARPVRRRRAT